MLQQDTKQKSFCIEQHQQKLSRAQEMQLVQGFHYSPLLPRQHRVSWAQPHLHLLMVDNAHAIHRRHRHIPNFIPKLNQVGGLERQPSSQMSGVQIWVAHKVYAPSLMVIVGKPAPNYLFLWICSCWCIN